MSHDLLQHAIATISYRFQKAISNAGAGFGDYKIAAATRSPNEIINHMYDLMNKTQHFIVHKNFNCEPPATLAFEEEVKRLRSKLKELYEQLSSSSTDLIVSKRLFQGPLSDVLTHVGQLAMLNGLHGHKVQKEDYSSADVGSSLDDK